MLKRAHMHLLRSLREHVGAEAGSAVNSWAGGFLDPGDSGGVSIEIITVWSRGGRDLVGLERSCAVSLPLLGPCEARGRLLLDTKVASAVRGLMLRTRPLPLAGKPTATERGLIAYAVASLLHELGPACEWSLALEDDGAMEGEGWLGVEARVELNNLTGLVWLLVTEAALDRRRSVRPPLAHLRAARAKRLDGVRIELPVVIARFFLAAREIEDLGEGDVILPEDWEHPIGPPYRSQVRVGEGWLPAMVDADRVTLTAPYQQGGGQGMSPGSTGQSEPDGSDADRGSLVDELPLEVVVELGRLKLKGAQVLDLGPGDVLTLDRPVISPLDLRVGDRLIAKGELVSVEGEAGVRLIEVYD